MYCTDGENNRREALSNSEIGVIFIEWLQFLSPKSLISPFSARLPTFPAAEWKCHSRRISMVLIDDLVDEEEERKVSLKAISWLLEWASKLEGA